MEERYKSLFEKQPRVGIPSLGMESGTQFNLISFYSDPNPMMVDLIIVQ